MEEIKLDTIEWTVPEYNHKEHDNDWFWTIGLIAIIACGVAIWFHSYIFAIFIFISGACLILFTVRPPEEIKYTIETKGLTMGTDLFPWKNIKSFNVKNNESDVFAKLLVQTHKHFLPIYTIPLPKDLVGQVKENLIKVTTRVELNESGTMVFMEKIGF